MDKQSSDLTSVVIVSYNKPQLLMQLLSCLQKQTYEPREIIAVLNCFPEDSIGEIRRRFGPLEIIVNKENLFFCKAHNQGIKKAQGKFILCLNDDLTLDSDFISEMVKAAKKNERIGMVNGCILRQNGDLMDSTGLFLGHSRRPVERDYGRKRSVCRSEGGYIFGAGGAAPLYRREMLEDIKIDNEYFDEDYGMFYEDLDLAWRAHNRRWLGYYSSEAIAYHHRGASSKQQEPRIGFMKKYNFAWLTKELKVRLLKNRYATILKNDSLTRFILHLPWFLLYEFKIWGYIFLCEPEAFKSFINDRTFIKKAWAKRKKLHLNR